MAHAIRIHKTGGPDVLQWEDVAVPQPATGECLVRNKAVGPGVSEFKPGDRVAYCNGPLGAYSELKAHPAERLVKLPDTITFEQAASMMLQGLTVQYLLRRLHLGTILGS